MRNNAENDVLKSWTQQLTPNLSREKWTENENKELLRLYKFKNTIGNKFPVNWLEEQTTPLKTSFLLC